MIRSTGRIRVTHQGTLPKPDDVRQMVLDKEAGKPYDAAAYNARLVAATREAVQLQLDAGIDSINDGELSKVLFSSYINDRLTGVQTRESLPTDPRRRGVSDRDNQQFAAYFNSRTGFTGQIAPGGSRTVCNGPIAYQGQAALQTDLTNFKAALQGFTVEEAYLPAVAPGTIEHFIQNDYYPNAEAFLFALADAMHDEYKAIVDAGFVLQIDDPDLPDAWQMYPEFSLAEYQKYATLRVDALNHALCGLPEDQVRFHMCWGSYKGPHNYDLPLRDFIDIMYRVNAGSYSIEATNPMHEHEWVVFKDHPLPGGKFLIPGVIGHANDFIEHPELVAERVIKYANLVGRENVVCGTDCGIGSRVGHPAIAWAKFRSMAEGARIATKALWK
ncbi:MAG: methionine synthase [Dehalococcoidia bacterium]|nr:methionine synthase [Dehalococcoidia bacterium]